MKNKNEMLNLLQSSLCGSDSVVNRNASIIKNGIHSHNNNLNNNFDQNIKMENDRISVITLKCPPLPPINSIPSQTPSRRSSFPNFFSQKYPDFFKNYCLCINRKIEPDDTLIETNEHEHAQSTNSKIENVINYQNHTSIVPITVALKMYVSI